MYDDDLDEALRWLRESSPADLVMTEWLDEVLGCAADVPAPFAPEASLDALLHGIGDVPAPSLSMDELLAPPPRTIDELLRSLADLPAPTPLTTEWLDEVLRSLGS
jgi:hypothetical protein